MKQATDERKTENPGRIARMIKKLDSRDQDLDPVKRRRKWIMILSVLFLLYLSSFLLPPPELSHPKPEPRELSLREHSPLSAAPDSSLQKSLTFEMPVDSFENLLKQRIHEAGLKKK